MWTHERRNQLLESLGWTRMQDGFWESKFGEIAKDDVEALKINAERIYEKNKPTIDGHRNHVDDGIAGADDKGASS